MTLTKGSASGGNKLERPWLPATHISQGMKGTVDVEPWQEEVDFGQGPKQVLRVPLKLDESVDFGEYGNTDMVVWTPGQIAAGEMVELFGQDEAEWVGVKGAFKVDWPWKTRTRSGKAVIFLPSGNGSASTSPGTTPAQHSRNLAHNTPGSPASKGRSVPTSPKGSVGSRTVTEFICGICAADPKLVSKFKTADELKRHFAEVHA